MGFLRFDINPEIREYQLKVLASAPDRQLVRIRGHDGLKSALNAQIRNLQQITSVMPWMLAAILAKLSRWSLDGDFRQ